MDETKRCFCCGEGLIWDSSTDRMDDENAVVDFYHCPKCGYSYEDKDYWNGK